MKGEGVMASRGFTRRVHWSWWCDPKDELLLGKKIMLVATEKGRNKQCMFTLLMEAIFSKGYDLFLPDNAP